MKTYSIYKITSVGKSYYEMHEYYGEATGLTYLCVGLPEFYKRIYVGTRAACHNYARITGIVVDC